MFFLMSCDCLLVTELRLDTPVWPVATERGRLLDCWYSIGVCAGEERAGTARWVVFERWVGVWAC